MRTTCEVFERLGIPLAPTWEDWKTKYSLKLSQYQNRLQNDVAASSTDKIRRSVSHNKHLVEKEKVSKKSVTLTDREAIFAAKVVPSGRIFLCSLIDVSATVKRLSHHISINKEAKEDINWWAEFLPSWHGRYRILDPTPTLSHDLKIFTDTSGR